MSTKISIDLGNLKVKAKTGGVKPLMLPSRFALLEDVEMVDMKGDKLDLNTYEINNMVYVWGKDIHKVPAEKCLTTLGYDDRYVGEEFQIMVKIVLAEMLHKNKVNRNVIVATGVPSSEMNTILEEQISEAFENDGKPHEIIRNGKSIFITVDECHVITQALGTGYNEYLDQEGFIANDEMEEIKIGIIDIGGGTTDCDLIYNLRHQKNPFSIDRGMFSIYEGIATQINKDRPKVKVTPEEIEDCFKKEVYTVKKGDDINFTTIKIKLLEKLARDIITDINRKWKKKEQLSFIFLTGGGASVMAEYIAEDFDNILVVENSEWANCYGFYAFLMNLVDETDGE